MGRDEPAARRNTGAPTITRIWSEDPLERGAADRITVQELGRGATALSQAFRTVTVGSGERGTRVRPDAQIRASRVRRIT